MLRIDELNQVSVVSSNCGWLIAIIIHLFYFINIISYCLDTPCIHINRTKLITYTWGHFIFIIKSFITSCLIHIFIGCHSLCVCCTTYCTDVPCGLDRDNENTGIVKKFGTALCHQTFHFVFVFIKGLDTLRLRPNILHCVCKIQILRICHR